MKNKPTIHLLEDTISFCQKLKVLGGYYGAFAGFVCTAQNVWHAATKEMWLVVANGCPQLGRQLQVRGWGGGGGLRTIIRVVSGLQNGEE